MPKALLSSLSDNHFVHQEMELGTIIPEIRIPIVAAAVNTFNADPSCLYSTMEYLKFRLVGQVGDTFIYIGD